MKVCFLGLGSMGSGVCRNLLNKGYALQVWNRSPEKAAKVAGWGAEAFATPQEATRGAGVVMSCLSSVAALKAVAGGANGVFSCMGEADDAQSEPGQYPAQPEWGQGFLAEAERTGALSRRFLKPVGQRRKGCNTVKADFSVTNGEWKIKIFRMHGHTLFHLRGGNPPQECYSAVSVSLASFA